MKERVQFVLEWEKRWNEGEGRLNLAALCRAFGISRQVGYMWLERYRKPARPLGPIKERTRRPMEALGAPLVSDRHVVLVSEELGDCLLNQRDFPGQRRLRGRGACAQVASHLGRRAYGWIAHHRLQVELPAESTNGVVAAPPRFQLVSPTPGASDESTQPVADVTGPNATWCVDVKGHFLRRCEPLRRGRRHVGSG
jgi:hypothetical protein